MERKKKKKKKTWRMMNKNMKNHTAMGNMWSARPVASCDCDGDGDRVSE